MKRTGGPLGRIAVLVLAFADVLALAASAAGAAANPTTASEISTVKNAKLGTILVAGDTAVYTLKGNKTCNASCQKSNPPVLLPAGMTSATAGTGVDASKLATKPAANGALQLTYGGKPLYWSTKDKSSAKVNGNGKSKFGTWAAVVISKSSSGSNSTTTTNSGNGGVGF